MNSNKDKKGFYLTLYAVATVFLLLAFGITILNSSADNVEEPIENSAPVGKSNVKPLTTTTTEATEATTESKAEEAKKEAITEATTASTLSLFDDESEMVWPCQGQILMDYSETAIYDKTLDQYRTNDSICISAALGDEVCIGADGVVTAITKDSEKGVCVSVDHGNGWSSTYSQLQDNLAVSEGESIEKGSKIGNVAQPTKYSVALGPHVEFSVYKNDEATDPKLVLASVE